MKKVIITIISALFLYSTSAMAEIGVNIGITGNAGLGAASAKETTGSVVESETEYAELAYASIFLEKEIEMLSIGVEYVPTAFESETADTAKSDMDGDSTQDVVTNSVQVDLEEMATLYIALNITDNAYVKAGVSTVDVITNENLATGASYGNTSLDGTMLGIGYNMELDSGIFVRAEGSYINYDGTSLTSGDQTINLKSLDAVTGKLSIGKSF